MAKRVLHGRLGRGRFFAYALGYEAAWDTVWEGADGGRVEFRLEGSRSAINQFSDTKALPSDRPHTGTTVDIRVDQSKTLSSLLDEDLPVRLAARFAPHSPLIRLYLRWTMRRELRDLERLVASCN